MARIPDLGRPYLLTRLDVASKDRRAVRAHHGRVDAKSRPRIAVKDRVRVGDKIFDARRLYKIFDARLVCAFRQPDASRPAAEMFFVIGDGDLDLCTL